VDARDDRLQLIAEGIEEPELGANIETAADEDVVIFQPTVVVAPSNHRAWQRSKPAEATSNGNGNGHSGGPPAGVPQNGKGKGAGNQPEAITFRTGSNQWVENTEWPPKQNVVAKKLYFHPNGKLSFDAPAANSQPAFDSYISDPAHPVPYRQRPIEVRSGWTTWLVQDQRFVHHRPDVLTWVTDTLDQDVVVSGKVIANLFASTSGTDSDWIVKLIDVYPDKYEPDATMSGYQLMIAGDVFRARYRKSFEKPEPLTANKIYHYEIGFPANDHTFRKGHRIMVQVQSTWFPVIDRNPQTFVSNIFQAKESDFKRAIQTVWCSSPQASYIALPVEAR